MKNNFIFSSLTESEKQDFVDAMRQQRVSAGDTIISQGDDGDNFYIVETGLCAISIAGVGRVMDVPSPEGRIFFGEVRARAREG